MRARIRKYLIILPSQRSQMPMSGFQQESEASILAPILLKSSLMMEMSSILTRLSSRPHLDGSREIKKLSSRRYPHVLPKPSMLLATAVSKRFNLQFGHWNSRKYLTAHRYI